MCMYIHTYTHLYTHEGIHMHSKGMYSFMYIFVLSNLGIHCL